MTDETNAGNGAAAGGVAGPTPGAQPQAPPVVRLTAHFTRDLSFENVAATTGGAAQGAPEINVTVNLDAGATGTDRYTVAMKINAEAKSGEHVRFIVELDYAGVFEMQNVPQEHIHPMLFIECPRLLLPFARRVVADVTRDGGYPPLMLDNVDFATLYRGKLQELQAKQAAEQSTET